MPFTHGVGWIELVIVLVIVMIVFGVGRLPEIGGALGKAIREFRSSQSWEVQAKDEPELEAQAKKES